jgi:hypothetical protein
MKLEIHVHVHHHDGASDDELRAVHSTLVEVKEAIMGELDTLKTEVSETKTVMASAAALLSGLKAKLDEAIASGDPAALQALSDELNTETNALAAAVAANTPAG